jgi:hypothetical protein
VPWGYNVFYSEFIFDSETKALQKCTQLQALLKDANGLDFGVEPITKKDAARIRKGETIQL